MLPTTLALSAFVMLLSVGRIVLGIWLLTAPLPLRDGARWRVPAALAGICVAYLGLAIAILMPLSARGSLGFAIGQFAVFSLLLIACVGATLVVYDTSVWTALFCCSAGYTVQNLASGATELVWALVDGSAPGVSAFYSPLRFVVSFTCTAVVYVAAYLLITRYLRRVGLGRIEDRSMIAAMAVTILVIIGFDLVIKWLVEQSIAKGAMVLLRMFHGLACAFSLTMEFELLVRRRVESERDTLGQVLAEHERQYETARENIGAINARVHDIRHAIGRMADGEGLPREAVRDLVREVTVYDSKVRTGNEALDTALTERRLSLQRAGVALTCVADGRSLAFLAPADTYTLFCCLLDALAGTDATSISLVVREALGTTSVHLESNGGAPGADALSGAEAIARRNGATFSTLPGDGAFHVNLLFPAQ